MEEEGVLKAIQFATRRHKHQLRKDNETPYISHPMRVLFILRHVFKVEDPEALASAVLHDTIEDTNTDHDDILKEFGTKVAEYVTYLTKDKRIVEDERERRYFDELEKKAPPVVKVVKMADTLDNLIDSNSGGNKAKTLKKAQELLKRFEPALQKEYGHVLERVRQEIKAQSRG